VSALRVEELRGWDREDRAPKLTAKQVRERFTAGILLGALYLRISEDDYLTEYGVERQEKDGTAFLAAQGIPLVDTYQDNNLSAKPNGPYRPEFERLLRDIASGRVNYVVASHWDRYERNGKDRERILAVAESYKCSWISLAGDTTVDVRTTDGQMIARMLGAVAQAERDNISRRVRNEKKHKADSGAWQGGPIPYGYRSARTEDGRPALAVDAEEAAVVRYLAAEVIRGRSLMSLAKELNERGTPPGPRAKQWYATSVRQRLMNPTVAGIRVYQGEEHGDAEWPAVLDRSTWRLVRTRLSDPKRIHRHEGFTRYLLTGFIYNAAGEKGNSSPIWQAGAPNNLTPGYITRGARVPAEIVDKLVLEAFFGAVREGAFGSAAEGEREEPVDDTELVAEITRLAGEIAETGERAGLDEDDPRFIDEDYALAKVRKLRERKRKVEQELEQVRAALPPRLSTVLGSAEELERQWESMTLEEKRELLSAVVERVTLYPKGTEPRVRVKLRGAVD
jgi:DNA invertase Pin-like site-specific DNA recombinase